MNKKYLFSWKIWISIMCITIVSFVTIVSMLTQQKNKIDTAFAKETVINVTDPPYNVKGDGTDETIAIQALLDLAKTNDSVYLYFPEGVYGMSGYLRLYGNTTIQMSKKATIKRLGKNTKMFVNGELGNKMYATHYNGEGNIHFNGGTIDLNAQGAPIDPNQSMSAFDIGHGKNISFSNVTIQNGQNGHYVQIASSADVSFKNCTFKNVSYHSSNNNVNFEMIQIEVATEKSFPSFGGYDGTISQDITIDRCSFENVIRAIGNHSNGKYGTNNVIYAKNITIKNSTFKNARGDMLHLTAFDHLIIKDNIIENANGHGIYAFHVINSTITGNTITNTTKSPIFQKNSSITW